MAEAASAGVNNRTEKVSALCNRYFSLIIQSTAGREENQRKSHYFTIHRMEAVLKKKDASVASLYCHTLCFLCFEDIFFFQYPEYKEESFSFIHCQRVWYLEKNGGIHGRDEEVP